MENEKPRHPETVSVNYNDPGVPENARTLRPLVWQDNKTYCVLLGPDPQTGVFARGETLRSALKNWDAHLKSVLATKKNSGELAQFIRDALNAAIYDMH